MIKRLISGFLIFSLMFTMIPSVGAVDMGESSKSVAESIEEYSAEYDFSVQEVDLYSLNDVHKYGIQTVKNIFEELSIYKPVKEIVLKDYTVLTYDSNALNGYNIPNLKKIVEFAKIGNDFCISYLTLNDEFVIATYSEDDTFSFTVNTNVATSDEVVEYSSTTKKLKKYEFFKQEMHANQEPLTRALKKVDAHPKYFPYVYESDANGILKQSSSKYCSAFNNPCFCRTSGNCSRYRYNTYRCGWISQNWARCLCRNQRSI